MNFREKPGLNTVLYCTVYLFGSFVHQEVDLLFLFDITGSMGSQIDGVKRQASNLVDSINSEYSSCVFRIGFVGYRLVGWLVRLR